MRGEVGEVDEEVLLEEEEDDHQELYEFDDYGGGRCLG